MFRSGPLLTNLTAGKFRKHERRRHSFNAHDTDPASRLTEGQICWRCLNDLRIRGTKAIPGYSVISQLETRAHGYRPGLL